MTMRAAGPPPRGLLGADDDALTWPAPQTNIAGPSIPAWEAVLAQTTSALKEQAPDDPTETQVAAAVQRAAQACTCPPVLEPVCGVDNVSYVSSCFAGCNGVAVQLNSSCSPARRRRAL
jgi:hypothetical protein